MSIAHVIMTRFNLATPGRESDLRNRDGWLERRFELFERYCLPSVAAQTETGFAWIVYFDRDTPPVFRARIEAARRIIPFVPYYTGLFRSEGWPRSIRETIPEADWLLTTHLDNDDALSSDHVARLRAAVDARPRRAGSFNGLHGLVRAGHRLYALRHPTNAFFSLLEPWDAAMRTCQDIGHMRIRRFGPVTQIPGPPGWLQVVHGENVSNKPRGRLIDPAGHAARFPPDALEGVRAPGLADRALQNGLLGPLRDLRDRASVLRQALRA
ncbi:glycosyltransferase [Jannaschia seohaensis]|uniref:Putative rhamnosyltransferase n=1 Tax=Jannaschia seohaensis TaxID=475081 RepID=A0A2Y9B2D5_9RHOB|nr:glycosyltransferase [Jannaschia seohaensis]PWJ12892.1 putative rhamnosyltransferase [Jannaschia seohaensis]SSA50700.1 Putative rhamnosyl transferase [Jannaschia seohaensis]